MYKITIKVDGQTVVLSTEETVRMAMQRGDLRRDTRVIVDNNDVEDFVGVADNFRWLSEQFDELDPPADPAPELTAQPTSKAPPEPEPATVAEVAQPAAKEVNAPARPDIFQSDIPPASPVSGQASPKAGNSASVWTILGVVAVIGGIVWLANRPDGSADYSDNATAYEEAPAKPEAPLYPVLNTGQMYTFPQYLTGSETYQVGDLVVQLGSVQRGAQTAPVIYITDAEGATFSISTVGYYSGAEFGVGDLDGEGVANDLILTGFTDGPLMDLQVATRVNGTWKAVNFGTWDGAVLNGFPTDMGGDTAPEFRMYDQAFLNTFEANSASSLPVQILKLRNGNMVDVTSDRAYRQIHINRMAELEPICREGSNGACAAYVASAARAQAMSPAWDVMLGSYQVTSWPLPTACLIPSDEACPASMEVKFDSYPEALQYFLGERGYSSKVYVRSKTWDGRASYDCSGDGLNEVLRTICSSSYLQLYDHQMAVYYTRALAFSRDRIGLQRRQQDWINERNALPADATLISESYQRRAKELIDGQG